MVSKNYIRLFNQAAELSAMVDYLHNPDPRRDRKIDRRDTIFTWRGFANVGFLLVVALALLGLL